jgi:rubrerythrin
VSGKAKPKKKKPTAKPKAVNRSKKAVKTKKPASVRTKKAVRSPKPKSTRATVKATQLDPQKKRIALILKKAIKGEEDGLHFYTLLAERASNAMAKAKLERLRDDEVRHKATLVGLYRQHVGGEIGKLPARGINALRKVFAKGHLDQRKTEMEFINLAIEAELAATKYYKDERRSVSDPVFQQIFDALADEEHLHYELLQAEKDALAGNYSWFGYGDAAPLED